MFEGKIRRWFGVCAVMAQALVVKSAHALTLDEALERASTHAPEVVAASHAVREAGARRVGAGVVMPVNPRLSVDARPPLSSGGPPDTGYAAMLEMLFDVGGAPSARVREAERLADVAKTDLATRQLEARAIAWTAYVEASIADARVAQTRELIGAAQRILDASKQRGAAGAAGDIEESIAAGDLAQLRASLEDAEREREVQLAALRDVLDLPALPVSLATPVGDPLPAPELGTLLEHAHRARPELAQARARIAFLDATNERLERETFPRVGGYVGVDASPFSPIFGVVGLSIELPIAQRNQGPRAVVAEARRGEIERLELALRRIDREVASTRASYEARRAQLAVLASSAVPAAERALELVEVGWRAGRFDVFRVASAARDVARAHGLRLDAFEAAWRERIALDRASGGGAR